MLALLWAHNKVRSWQHGIGAETSQPCRCHQLSVRNATTPLPLSFPIDCSAECQARHWKEGGHRQACKSAAIVLASARLGQPCDAVLVGHYDS